MKCGCMQNLIFSIVFVEVFQLHTTAMSLLRNVSLFHQMQSNKFIFWCKFVRHADKNRLVNNLSSGFVPKKVLENIRTNLFSNPAYRSRLLFIPNISHLDISSLFDEKKLPDHDIDLEDANLLNLSDDELRSFACKLSNRRPSSISRSLKERLENECCSRTNRFDSVSLLFFADVFSRLHLDSVRYMSCVYRILYNHWDQLALEKEDVLLLTYFMVTFRTLTPQINFMHRIEHYVQTNMNRFSLNELSLICLAFFSTNTSFREHTTLENLSVKVLEDIHKTDLNLMHLCNILKVLRHARFTKLSFYEQLADPILFALSKSKQKANFMELNHIATTYSALKIYHQKLFDTIKRQAVDILANKETRYIFRMKDLTRLVWALSTFANHVPKPILDKLVETMNNDKRMLTLYSESFTEALLSLAMNRVYPDNNLLTLFFSPEFLKLKSGRILEQNFQVDMLHSAIRLEHNSEFGNELPEEFTKEKGNLMHELNTRKGLLALVNSLHDVLGGWSFLKCHFIFRFSMIADIELHLDKDGRPVNFNEDGEGVSSDLFPQLASMQHGINSSQQMSNLEILMKEEGIQNVTEMDWQQIHLKPNKSKQRKEEIRKLCIKVMGLNQYALNQPILLGIHQMEQRLLTKLGYEVYVITRSIQRIERIEKLR